MKKLILYIIIVVLLMVLIPYILLLIVFRVPFLPSSMPDGEILENMQNVPKITLSRIDSNHVSEVPGIQLYQPFDKNLPTSNEVNEIFEKIKSQIGEFNHLEIIISGENTYILKEVHVPGISGRVTRFSLYYFDGKNINTVFKNLDSGFAPIGIWNLNFDSNKIGSYYSGAYSSVDPELRHIQLSDFYPDGKGNLYFLSRGTFYILNKTTMAGYISYHIRDYPTYRPLMYASDNTTYIGSYHTATNYPISLKEITEIELYKVNR